MSSPISWLSNGKRFRQTLSLIRCSDPILKPTKPFRQCARQRLLAIQTRGTIAKTVMQSGIEI